MHNYQRCRIDAEVTKITAYLTVLHNDAPEFWLTINTVLIGLYYL